MVRRRGPGRRRGYSCLCETRVLSLKNINFLTMLEGHWTRIYTRHPESALISHKTGCCDGSCRKIRTQVRTKSFAYFVQYVRRHGYEFSQFVRDVRDVRDGVPPRTSASTSSRTRPDRDRSPGTSCAGAGCVRIVPDALVRSARFRSDSSRHISVVRTRRGIRGIFY